MVQARLNSKRLPGKMLKKIEEKTILEHCMETAFQLEADSYHLLVPASETKEFFPIASKLGWSYLTGSEDNVLSRFVDAIELSKCDIVVRVTGDKVIGAIDYVRNAISNSEHYDLISYEENPLLSTTYCVIKSEILLRAAKEVNDKKCLEHVKPCINYLGGNHLIINIPQPLRKYNYNFTIDTQEDFDKISKMFYHLYDGKPIKFEDALLWMEKEEYS